MRKSVWMMVATIAVLGASLSGQQRVITKIDPFDYDVAPNWSLPYAKANYAWGSVPGIFVESDDRDRKSTRLNSSHLARSRMPSSA